MKNLQINEDFERESIKDSIYLLEEQMLTQHKLQEDLHRKPATIQVIDKDKILEKNEHKYNPLPF